MEHLRRFTDKLKSRFPIPQIRRLFSGKSENENKVPADKAIESKVEDSENENKLVLEKAQKILLEFISAEVQSPKRVIYPNKYQPNIAIKDFVYPDKPSIIRLAGNVRHRSESLFWFLLISHNNKTYRVAVNTHGQTVSELRLLPINPHTLENPRLVDTSLSVPVIFLINHITNRPHDEDFASSSRIDVMFAGSPEKSNQETGMTLAPDFLPQAIPNT